MKTILITGCNRGLGLGLVKNLLKRERAPEKLIATCRDLQKAQELMTVASNHKNLHVLQLDVKNFNRYDEFKKLVEDIVEDSGLNLLINNAGISPKFTRLNYVKYEQLLDTLVTNTIAPIMLTKTLLPLLMKATKNDSSFKSSVVNMSSILGSIDANTTGGLYPYRCSKAALNMATKTMSVDLQNNGVLVTCLHPGWVKTDMGGSNAPLTVDESTTKMIDFLYRLNEKHNGGFFQYDGTSMNW